MRETGGQVVYERKEGTQFVGLSRINTDIDTC